jgi:hypothetical protein
MDGGVGTRVGQHYGETNSAHLWWRLNTDHLSNILSHFWHGYTILSYRIYLNICYTVSGCLYNVFGLKNICQQKVRYVFIKLMCTVLTYASETRAETTYTQQLLRTTKMKTIRAIHGKTLRDKIRSDQLWQLSGIQDIIKWANVQRKEWGARRRSIL